MRKPTVLSDNKLKHIVQLPYGTVDFVCLSVLHSSELPAFLLVGERSILNVTSWEPSKVKHTHTLLN